MELDQAQLDGYSAEELENELHRLDDVKQAVRADQRLVLDALCRRQAQDAAQAKVSAMGTEEREALLVALNGVPSEAAVS